MGIDIHFHSEIKVNGVWHHYGANDVPRFYGLFAKLAGVRPFKGIEPIVPPRGMPVDPTLVTRLDYELSGADGHHHTWFGPEEIIALEDWFRDFAESDLGCDFEDVFGYLFGNTWGGRFRYPSRAVEYPFDDVRFILWFEGGL